MSARLLVAVLCVCCNGTSVTVLSLCSVSRAIGAERSLFARDGRQIDVQGQPRDRGIYIFANADSQKQIQIADFRFLHRRAVIYIIHSQKQIQIADFRFQVATRS